MGFFVEFRSRFFGALVIEAGDQEAPSLDGLAFVALADRRRTEGYPKVGTSSWTYGL